MHAKLSRDVPLKYLLNRSESNPIEPDRAERFQVHRFMVTFAHSHTHSKTHTHSHAGRRHWQINYLPNQFTIYA